MERVESSVPLSAIESEPSTEDRVSGGSTADFWSEPIKTQLNHIASPLRVEATGSGRAWRFSYCGPDGILGTIDDPVSSGHLKLPAGADVVIQLRSDDYIYVFSCPGLKLKEIAVPDLEFSIAFRADRRGEYDLAMDPICGFRLPPGKTMGTLSVSSKTQFRHWLGDLPRSH